MPFTLCSSAAIVAKAGRNVNTSASTSSALLEQFSNEAEHFVNTYTRYDWVASPNVTASFALQNATSNLAAVKLILYDMSGYTGLSYAGDTINYLWTDAIRILDLLKDDPNRSFAISGKTGAE